jgi:hypothetical protein
VPAKTSLLEQVKDRDPPLLSNQFDGTRDSNAVARSSVFLGMFLPFIGGDLQFYSDCNAPLRIGSIGNVAPRMPELLRLNPQIGYSSPDGAATLLATCVCVDRILRVLLGSSTKSRRRSISSHPMKGLSPT